MSTSNMGYIDFHSHILPGMDDGSRSVEMSLAMLEQMKAQGVIAAAATSHYIPHRESVVEYLERREMALLQLMPALEDAALPQVLPGAEIYLERGLSERDLRPLCLGKTAILLLELPRAPFEEWMIYEIENIQYTCSAVPVLAHLERYLDWYSREEIRAVLAIEQAVSQLSVSAFTGSKFLKFARELQKAGLPLLFGSDAHNLILRPPNWDVLTEKLRRKPKLNALLETASQTAQQLGVEG